MCVASLGQSVVGEALNYNNFCYWEASKMYCKWSLMPGQSATDLMESTSSGLWEQALAEKDNTEWLCQDHLMFNPVCLIPSVKVFPLSIVYNVCWKVTDLHIWVNMIATRSILSCNVVKNLYSHFLSFTSRRIFSFLVRTTFFLLSFSRRSIKRDGSYEPKHHVVACSALGTNKQSMQVFDDEKLSSNSNPELREK